MSRRWLLAAMLASVALVTAAMLIDERREFDGAVRALQDEQSAIATAVAADFEARLARHEEAGAVEPHADSIRALIPKLLGGAMELEQKGSRILLIACPDEPRLLTTDGRRVHSPTLRAAFAAGRSGTLLSRAEAPQLGLPARVAIAGIEPLKGRAGRWGVVVLVSGERLRERERHSQLRFLLSVGLVLALVAGFGGVALRQERRQLQVARKLEVAALERDRERLLAQADKMATLAALSSGIAHEVATPLGTIMARVEQVLPAVEGQHKASAALRVALEQVERIQAVIRGVLGLARGEHPTLVQADPGAIARSAVSLARHRFEEAGVRVALDTKADLPPIACDKPLLEQALTNLLLNACDASPRGSSVHMRVRVEPGKLCFLVEDEGEGISPETAESARKPFFTTKPKGRGTGLGLAIAQEVVAHHGGKLILEKRERAPGTRAVIELART